jgi:hypothetical protein
MMHEESRSRCAGCGAATVAADIGMPPRFQPARSESAAIHFAGVPIHARVCPSCARIAFFARDTSAFEQPRPLSG